MFVLVLCQVGCKTQLIYPLYSQVLTTVDNMYQSCLNFLLYHLFSYEYKYTVLEKQLICYTVILDCFSTFVNVESGPMKM